MESEIKQNYIYDWLIVGTSVLLAILFLIFDLIDYQFIFREPVYWFQRTGSLLVLFAVILEFRQLYCMEPGERMEDALNKTFLGFTASRMNDKQIWFQRFAISLSVIGTLIWGYGDLFFKT